MGGEPQAVRLFVHGLAVFFPFGVAQGGDWLGIVLALPRCW